MTDIITINTKGLVPNHLNDTNIFCRYASNTVIEVEPKEVHFAGYKLNERNYQEIKFTNISDEISRFHIIPPVSKYFQLKYTKPERMVPGFNVKCMIIFTPDKARNYNDFIKIHTRDSENNVIIPIYAYPAIQGLQVPRNIAFPVTPIGHICTKHLTLHSDSNVEFVYEIVVVKDHPSISIDKLTGVIPVRGDTFVVLSFHPTDYVTCEKTINIYVSQYNFKPITCTLIGNSEPGLERKLLTIQSDKSPVENSDLISLSKLELKRKSMKSKPILDSEIKNAQPNSNWKSNKKKLKSDFESRVRENVTIEKQNQIRWQTFRGSQPVSDQEVDEIKNKREIAFYEYNLNIRNQNELSECYKNLTVDDSNWERTFRFDSYEKEYDDSINTPQFVPECWMVRKIILDRFRSAAFKVIVNNRLQIRLKRLVESGGNYHEVDTSNMYPGGKTLTFSRPLDELAEERLPKYQITFENKFDMTEYKLLLPIQPQYSYLDLQVPLQMHVLNYERVDTSSLNYQSAKSDFKARSSADTEVVVSNEVDEIVAPIVFSKPSNTHSFIDKDKTLTVFPHNCSYFDNYSYFPLYYYENELLENKAPIDMDWKVSKSLFLMCKKNVKSNKNPLLVKALESSLLPQQAPNLMKKSDLDQLDYRNSNDGPTIDSEMMYAEFPVLKTLTENLYKMWND